MLDEERIEGDPVAAVDDARQRRFGLLGALRPHDAEPVRDPVDVGVHGDRRDAVAEDEDAVRRLGSDVGQAHQGGILPRDDAAELGEDRLRAVPDGPALDPIEAGRPDERLDRVGRGRGERGRVGEPGEQPGARGVGVRVARALGEDRPDQHLERILGVVPQVRGPPIARAVQRREPVEDRLPVAGGEPRRRHVRPRADTGAVSTPGSERSGSSSAPPSCRRSSPTR